MTIHHHPRKTKPQTNLKLLKKKNNKLLSKQQKKEKKKKKRKKKGLTWVDIGRESLVS